MNILANIAVVLCIISSIVIGVSLFGDLYNKITKKASKLLSDIGFVLIFISGIFSWAYLLIPLFK